MHRAPTRRRHVAVLSAFAVFMATAATGAVAVTGTGQAHAAETYLPSDSATFALSGHGSGHARGMSQWGAYGMATEGQTAQQILDFYYPGTQTTTAATNAPVRVWLSQDEGTDVDIVAALGAETVTNSAGGPAITLPKAVGAAPVTNWKATRDTATGLTTLWGRWQGAWQAYPVAPQPQLSTTGTLTFTSDRGLVRLVYPDNTERDYQGSIAAVPDAGVLRTVNIVPMEDYLKGVVPHEVVNSWPLAALEAQAIAARTFATARLGAPLFDVCDSTACQIYSGVASFDAQGNQTANLESAQTNAAIAAVAGQIRTFSGQPISAQYSSSDGGWTVSGGTSWEPAQPDPFDHYAPYHDWSQTLSSAAIEAAYPAVGVLTSLVVNQRDGNGQWGGRVLSLTVNGTGGSVTVTGSAFQTAMALKSSWFTVGDGAQGPASGGYLHAVVPARILDTRTAGNTAFMPGQTRAVQVAGLGGVPADAIGVVLNVTATDTSSSSYLTVWPQPNPQPNTSNLNWDRPGQTVANLVYTGLGPSGAVLIYNNLGRASVVVDVFGYYEPATVAGGLGFVPVTPNRILDTRYAIGGPAAPLGAAETRNVAVEGTAAIRADAAAVLVNLTSTRPTAISYLTLWPAGITQPGTSNLNTLPGETRANAALDLLGNGGLSLYNNRGTSDAIIDVLGQYVPPDGVSGQFVALQPSRLLDTRTSTGGHQRPMGAAETFALPVLGRGGVPANGVSAVVLNVTAVAPSGQTFVTAWPSGIPRPGASNLNAAPGAVVPNLVVSGIGADGTVDLYNDVGSTGLVVDVVGWISG